jgi:Uma2 family endonuclease
MSARVLSQYHVEFLDGEKREKPWPKKLHSRIQRYLILKLAVLLPQGFEVMPELNVLTGRTANGRREYVVPDVQVVGSSAQYEDGDLADPPVLAVEILSPGQTITDMFVRADHVMQIGAVNTWVIWPEKRRAWSVGREEMDEATTSLDCEISSGNCP